MSFDIRLGTIGFLIFLIVVGSVLIRDADLRNVEIGKIWIKIGIAGIWLIVFLALLNFVSFAIAMMVSSIISMIFSFLFLPDPLLIFLLLIVLVLSIIFLAMSNNHSGRIV